MKVMIHAIQKRMWYVERFLVPSLTSQGISPVVYCDTGKRGNLGACLDSFRHIRGGGTWHIQDDVIISRRFAELAEQTTLAYVMAFAIPRLKMTRQSRERFTRRICGIVSSASESPMTWRGIL